jgi:glycerol uptake facilitator protein
MLSFFLTFILIIYFVFDF